MKTRTELETAYLYHRRNYSRPKYALGRARADMESNTRRYLESCNGGLGAPFNGGLRWCENPASYGFRWCGWADEIARRDGYWRAIDHRGWFTDSIDQSDVMRGCVYQLPARNGKPLFFAAYRNGYDSRNGWQDSAYGRDYGAAVIDMRESVVTRALIYESAYDAAKAADSLAESSAETEREYNDSWQAARQWEDLGESMQETRQAARQLVSDMRAAIRSGITAAPSICDALRERLRALLGQWEAMREEREAIADSFYYRENDKRLTVAEFAASHL